MAEFKNTIGDLLKAQGRNQKWLAKEIGKGITMTSLYCNNHNQPTLDTAKLIADALNVSVSDLIPTTE